MVSTRKASKTSGWEALNQIVLKNGYCCGCGVCASICPVNALAVRFDAYGEYRPYLAKNCTDCGLCSKVCPFIDENPDENKLGSVIYAGHQDSKYTPETGYYLENFVGHVSNPEDRWRAASGGMATWFLKTLIKDNVVDHVICVLPKQDSQKLFDFDIISKAENMILSAKSVYYPVELSNILNVVRKRPGRYALIGLPCFIKAVRLATLHNVKLKKRIVFFAGLTCGHTVSKGFVEVLSRSMNIIPERISSFNFRVKEEGRERQNFSMIVAGRNRSASTEALRLYASAWGKGILKPRACNFCDDIFAELSDISFMDARLPDYSKITAGTSIVIARSDDARRILNEYGIVSKECVLKKIDVQSVIKSQADLCINKRNLLKYRLWLESKKGKLTLNKRVEMKRPSVLYRLMIFLNESIRARSFIALKDQNSSGEPGLKHFMRAIRWHLLLQKFLQKVIRLQTYIRPR